MGYENRKTEEGGFTFHDVEDRLVETMVLWRRSPGEARWPFAGDGPWHLARDDGSWQAAWDHQVNAHKQGYQDKPRALPLSLAEIAERDSVSEWIARYVPERDRRLVVLGLMQLAKGRPHIRWKEVRGQLKEEVSPRGLGMRYSRAITNIAKSLEKLSNGVSMQLVNREQNKGCSPSAS